MCTRQKFQMTEKAVLGGIYDVIIYGLRQILMKLVFLSVLVFI